MTITDKARKHIVYTHKGKRDFVVQSGTSGNFYKLHLYADGSLDCDCKWYSERQTDCSHAVAVRDSLSKEKKEEKSLYDVAQRTFTLEIKGGWDGENHTFQIIF